MNERPGHRIRVELAGGFGHHGPVPPPMMEALLTELDPLSHRQRQRMLAARARELAADGRLATLASEAVSLFEREVVLFLGTVARNGAIVARALHDENSRLRAQALRACRHVPVPDDTLVELLGDAPRESRRRIYRLVRRERLTQLADRLFAVVVRRWGEVEAATLLPACSAELVARELPGLAYAVPNWKVMALGHPSIVLESGRQELAGATRAGRQRWWWRQGAGVLALAAEHPEAVFELLERYPVDGYPSGLAEALAALARRDPTRLFNLMDRPEHGYARRLLTRPCLLRGVRSLPVEWLAGFLCRHGFGGLIRHLVLETLPPSQRAELFDRTREHLQPPDDPTPESTLRVLSHSARVREARRSLALTRVREDEETALRYTAYLPFTEAEAALVKATARHLAEERAAGYELLFECAARSNDTAALSRVLGMLARLRNEQDPVRARVIAVLSTVPVRLFTPGAAEPLGEVTRDAVAARDASFSTRDALGRLAVRLLAHRSGTQELARWALSTLDGLYGAGRLPLFMRLDRVLRRGQEREFFAAVRPWVEAGVARANYEPLFTVTRALARRAWRVDGLQALLAAAIDDGNTQQVNRDAIELWLDDPARRSQRVETVLRGDSSTVALGVVWWTLSTVRTDLLDLVLDGRGPRGKHLAAGVRWVPNHAPHVERWLPRQHRRYLDLLTRVAGDAGANLHRRVTAIRTAATIPVIGWSLAEKYHGSANTVLDEAALGALIWTDRPAQALPILLSHVDDDRARVAVYALSRAADFVPPSAIRPVFAEMLHRARKVTSRKEAVRLLSKVAPRDAMADIIPAWQADQHRDVRVAIVSAARSHLAAPESWRVLGEAAGDAERAVAQAVVQVTPGDLPVVYRERYAALVGRVCRHADPFVARMAWAVYPQWAIWTPGALDDITYAVCDLDTLTVWRAAADALIGLLDEGFGVGRLEPVFERLILSDVDGPDAEVDRDRPARQRLIALAHKLITWTQARRQFERGNLAEVSAIGELLARQPGYLETGLELMVWSIPVDDGLPDRLDRLGALAGDRPLAAQALAEAVLARLNRERDRLPLDLIRQTAWALAAGDGFVPGLLALSLARCAAASPSGWAAAQDREVLRRLRRHPHADVRASALSHYTRAE